MARVIKPSSSGMHPKIGGGSWPSGKRGPSIPHGALPRRTVNPFRQARTMLNRSIGLAKSQKGRPY